MTIGTITGPLDGDPRRDAGDTIGGFLYQAWQTLLHWLQLNGDEVLFVEASEDIEVSTSKESTAIQVKRTTAPITLRSASVRNLIDSFVTLQEKNPNRTINVVLITTSAITQEEGDPFGPGLPGLSIWNQASHDVDAATKLKAFLGTDDKLLPATASYLSGKDVAALQTNLFRKIRWYTRAPAVQAIESTVNDLLITYGLSQNVRPSDAVSTKSALLKQILEIAATKGVREPFTRALFARKFEELTTVRIPTSTLQAFQNLAAQLATSPQMQSGTEHLSVTGRTRLIDSPPPLVRHYIDRNAITKLLGKRLKQNLIVCLSGSVGLGKSTIAKQIAARDDEKWGWVTIPDFDNRASHDAYFRLLTAELRDRHDISAIVLDDLPTAGPAGVQAMAGLERLLPLLLAKRTRVLITSQGSLSQRLLRDFDLSSDAQVFVSPLDEDEIQVAAIARGCAQERSTGIARMIFLHTAGHTQLVAARLTRLQRQDWPEPSASDLLSTPAELQAEKESARRRLVSEAAPLQLELLYRLSLVHSSFSRALALNIANVGEPVKQPGDHLDALVGPWIERLGSEEFRISSLLSKAAEDVWSQDQVSVWHSRIADAVTRLRTITPREVATVLFHGLIGRNPKAITRIVAAVTKEGRRAWAAMASHLTWLPMIFSEDDQGFFGGDKFARFVFRNAQFLVAAETDITIAARVAEVWKRETTPYEPKRNYLLSRISVLTTLLLSYQVPMEAEELLNDVKELRSLIVSSSGLVPLRIKSTKGLPKEQRQVAHLEVPQVMFSFFWARCKDARFFESLLRGLAQLEDDFRNYLLKVFSALKDQSTLLIDAVWLSEEKKQSPNWPHCIELFERAYRHAVEWNSPELAAGVTRALMVVFDEYVKNSDLAVQHAHRFKKHFGDAFVVDEQLATIQWRADNWQQALAAYEEVIAGRMVGKEEADLPLGLTLRKAAISAAHLKKWALAGYYFREAAIHMKSVADRALPAGAYADAAFCYWKAEQFQGCRDAFARSFRICDDLRRNDTQFSTFATLKFIGHVIVHINMATEGQLAADAVEPRPGCCSDLKKNEEVKKLGPTPVDTLWAFLSRLELSWNLNPDVYHDMMDRLRSSSQPTARYLAREADIAYCFRSGRFNDLPAVLVAFNDEMDATRNDPLVRRAQAVKAEQQPPLLEKEKRLAALLNFLDMALIQLICTKEDELSVVSAWCMYFASHSLASVVNGKANEVKRVSELPYGDVAHVLTDREASRDSRLIAAARLAVSDVASPRHLFYAHTLLLNDPIVRKAPIQVGASLARSVKHAWSRVVENRSTLINPRVHVPDIVSALARREDNLSTVAAVLLAAEPTVDLKIPMETRIQLKALAGLQRP